MGYRKDKKCKYDLVKTININGCDTIIFTLPESTVEGKECSLNQEQQYRIIRDLRIAYPNFEIVILPPKAKMTFVKSK